MGLDLRVWVKASDGLEDFGGFKFCKREPQDSVWDMPDASTHACHHDDFDRYFSESYQRGHWPTYAKLFLLLLGNPKIETVFFSSDCAEPYEQGTPAMTLEKIAEFNRAWVERRRNVETL